MKHLMWLLLALGLMVQVQGCTVAKISGAGPRPIMLNNPPQGVAFDVIKHFKVQKGITFDLTSSFEIDGIVADLLQETKGDAIINVRLNVVQTPGDFCMTMVCPFSNAKHIEVEGDVIKFK